MSWVSTVKEVEYRLIANKFSPAHGNTANQWITDVDQLETIKTKFETKGLHLILPVEYAAKALFVEAEQLAQLGVRTGDLALSHLRLRVFVMTTMPLVGYSYDYIAEMTELIRYGASALRLPLSVPPHLNQSTRFVPKSIVAELMA